MPVSTERKRNVSLTPRTRANYKVLSRSNFFEKRKERKKAGKET
jgi:hypothetical protein